MLSNEQSNLDEAPTLIITDPSQVKTRPHISNIHRLVFSTINKSILCNGQKLQTFKDTKPSVASLMENNLEQYNNVQICYDVT